MNLKTSLVLLVAASGLVLGACGSGDGDVLTDEQKIAKEKAIRAGTNNAAGGAPVPNGGNYQGGSSSGGGDNHSRGGN